MKTHWIDSLIYHDDKLIHEFNYPVRAALDVREMIIVILDGPKVDIDDEAALVDEMNRNVYGLNRKGDIVWRISSHGTPNRDSLYYCNPFLYVAEWGEAVVLYTGDGPNVLLDPANGSFTSLTVSKRNELLERAKLEGRIRCSPEDPIPT